MTLDEARLKSHALHREGADTTAASGLSQPGEPTELEVEMDLQASSTPRFSREDGQARFVGGFTAFTYDDRVQVGDVIHGTTHGTLRVESVEMWDDEEPTHYEIGLVPA